MFERLWMPICGLTAAAVITTAAVAMPSQDPAETLVLAADAISEVRSARMEMTGTFAMELSFGEVPEGLPFAELGDEADELDRLFAEGLDFSFSIDGDGAMVAPDRMRMDGAVTVEGGAELGLPGPFEMGVVLIGDQMWFQIEEMWFSAPLGDEMPFEIDPQDLSEEFLREPIGEIEDLGTEELDGERVRHLRFEAAGPDLAEAEEMGFDGNWTTEAWLGEDDDLLRRIDIASDGAFEPEGDMAMAAQLFGGLEGGWDLSFSIRLFDHNAEIGIEPPPADLVQEGGEDPFGFLSPFGGPFGPGSLDFGS